MRVEPASHGSRHVNHARQMLIPSPFSFLQLLAIWHEFSLTIKGGGRPTRLLAHAKMLLIPIKLFFSAGYIMLWKVLHLILSKCDFSRMFHTERS